MHICVLKFDIIVFILERAVAEVAGTMFKSARAITITKMAQQIVKITCKNHIL